MSAVPPHVRHAVTGAQLYLAFEGNATHRVSLTGEHLAIDFLSRDLPQPKVVLDLDGCRWLDSTFAGWMINLQQRLKQAGGRLIISRCTPACRTALEVMGLTGLFEFGVVEPPAQTKDVACAGPTAIDADTVEFMLHAHEELAAANPDNARLFAPIADTLRNELKGSRDPQGE